MSETVSPRPRGTDPTKQHPDDATTDAEGQAGDVAEHGRQQAKGVAKTAREGASQVAEETSRQTRRLMDETMGQLRTQATDEAHRVGGALHTLGERLEALADGEPEKAGPLGEYVQQFASQTHQIAQRIDELGFDGVVRELSSFARRRPGAFLVSTAVAGFASARLGRGVAKSDDESASSEPRSVPSASDAPDVIIDLDEPAPPVPVTEPAGGSMPDAPTTPLPTSMPAPDREIRR